MPTTLVGRPFSLHSRQIPFAGSGNPGLARPSVPIQIAKKTETSASHIATSKVEDLQKALIELQNAEAKAEADVQKCQTQLKRAQNALNGYKRKQQGATSKRVTPPEQTEQTGIPRPEIQTAQRQVEEAEAALKAARNKQTLAGEEILKAKQRLRLAQPSTPTRASMDQPESTQTPKNSEAEIRVQLPQKPTQKEKRKERRQRTAAASHTSPPMPSFLQALSRLLPQSAIEKTHQKYLELFSQAKTQIHSSNPAPQSRRSQNTNQHTQWENPEINLKHMFFKHLFFPILTASVLALLVIKDPCKTES